jgi:Fe(3+) dicitrate transport protein
MKLFLIFCLNYLSFIAYTQTIPSDSSKHKNLDEVVVQGYRKDLTISNLPSVKGVYIFAGKKSEIIPLDKMDANVVDNNPRQIFAKIPGVFVFETDGSGNQVNIATRGLTAHRSWEMNVRQNDVMTNSDLYGYPASHFNAPMESIQRIEIVRGSGSLQYGGQFGGMVNYISKEANDDKKISYETQNSLGSFGLLSTYNALSGKINKFKYFAYYNYRESTGYRENSEYQFQAYRMALQYDFSPRFTLKAQYNRMNYVNHLNGGLNDAQFYDNPRQSTRTRNYYSPDIHLPSLHLDYKIGKNTIFNFISSAVLGSRSSVQFIALSTIRDTLNTKLGTYNPRQVDIDEYNSYAHEGRLRHKFNLDNIKNTIVTGIRYINNNLIRRQLGKGTTGSDFDLTLTNPIWGRDLSLKTTNISFFLENLLELNPKLSLTAGLRYENGKTNMTGKINYYDSSKIPVTIAHQFALLGFGAEYHISPNISALANWSQAYRPVIFADIIPTTALNQVNPNIKDAYGSNAELGIRGEIAKGLRLDFTLFALSYHNRIGDLIHTNEQGQTYFYKTNTGNSLSKGFELYAEIQPMAWLYNDSKRFQFSMFTSTSLIDAQYVSGTVVVSGKNVDISGNRIEAAPRWISRNGLQMRYKKLSGTLQYSFIGDAFADALNTENPNASGTLGLVPAYQLVDLNFIYRFLKKYNIKLITNNLFNHQYFTERPAFFPGPGGLYPSDGRSIILSIGAKF